MRVPNTVRSKVRSTARSAVRFSRPPSGLTRVALAAVIMLAASLACRREAGQQVTPAATTTNADPRNVRCVERPEGCIFCDGSGQALPLLEPDEAPSSLCDSKDPANC